MARSQKDDDDRFSWCEHLLYKQGKPLMWLVELPDEYRIVSLVEPGMIDVRDGSVRYGGDTWKNRKPP